MQFPRMSRHALISFFVSLILLASITIVATAGSTTRELGTNFTLVNLYNGLNQTTISYFKPDGTQWTFTENVNLSAFGDQFIRSQYGSTNLSAGNGSVVVNATGPVGSLIQVQARNGQIPSSGAYIAATSGSINAHLPLVFRNKSTTSGNTNSRIMVQNTTLGSLTFTIRLYNPDGTLRYTKSNVSLQAGAAYQYDLDDESRNNVPTDWYGSATVTANNGTIAVVSHIFSSYDSLQSFSGFPSGGQKWAIPLFTAKLSNGLSTPVTVQNLSGGTIPAYAIALYCKKDANSPGVDFTKSNPSAVVNRATFIFNPVIDASFTSGWYGYCTVTTTGYDTATLVQMRFAGLGEDSAYEAIKVAAATTKFVIPLYAKRLSNGFATSLTIQNLSISANADITLQYKGATGTAAGCTQTFTAQIAPSSGYIQNHRLASGAGSVSLPDGCYGSLIVTSSNQPIGAMMQLTNYTTNAVGDQFMAHIALPVSN